jgi:redox-sensitive bicupin YhaK (pirin superfamily)
VKYRQVARVVRAQETSDGAGVRLKRSLGSAALDYWDPFLLLDEFKSEDASDYLAGFPDHPHRGFETVTYMLAGSMEHRDHRGNQGNLVAGSVQWMTAGRGIIHSEMPKQKGGLMWGFQLWVNLPAREKMTEPRYQDIPPAAIPSLELPGGGTVRVIAGESRGVSGAVRGIATDPLYLDVRLAPQAVFEQPVAAGHSSLVYVFEGEAEFGGSGSEPGRRVGAGHLLALSAGAGEEALRVSTAEVPVAFLLLAARPLREPMARYGPFVMNTAEEIRQAFRDYQNDAF